MEDTKTLRRCIERLEKRLTALERPQHVCSKCDGSGHEVGKVKGYSNMRWIYCAKCHGSGTTHVTALEGGADKWTPKTGSLKEQIKEAFRTNLFEFRECRVLELRHGLTFGPAGGHCYSLAEVGDRLKITREHVRQIERRALKKLAAQTPRALAEPVARDTITGNVPPESTNSVTRL